MQPVEFKNKTYTFLNVYTNEPIQENVSVY